MRSEAIPKEMYRRYFLALMSLVSCGLGLVALGNWLTDPFNLYGTARYIGISEFKPFAYYYEPQTKKYMLDRIRPEILILGNSRPDYGLNPRHIWRDGPATYNAAYGGGSFVGAMYYFRRALDQGTLRQVVLAVDSDMFARGKRALNVVNSGVDDLFNIEMQDKTVSKGMEQADWWAPLFSLDSVEASAKTLICHGEKHKYELMQSGNTRIHQELFEDSAKQRFAEMEKRWARKLYHPDDGGAASFAVGPRKLKSYRKLLRLAYASGIDMSIYINPSHARKYLLYRAAGQEEQILDWKRAVVRVNEEEAQHAGRRAFPVWDFLGFDRYSSETVTDSVRMQWWVEASHYTEALGNKVLDRLFDNSPDMEFGAKIDDSNIEEHIGKLRKASLSYWNNHPEDAKDIEAVIQEAIRYAKSGYLESVSEPIQTVGYCDSN